MRFVMTGQATIQSGNVILLLLGVPVAVDVVPQHEFIVEQPEIVPRQSQFTGARRWDSQR